MIMGCMSFIICSLTSSMMTTPSHLAMSSYLFWREGLQQKLEVKLELGGCSMLYQTMMKCKSSLEIVIMRNLQQTTQALLHAAVIARAPRHIIIDSTNRCHQCVLMKNSLLNHYPIDVAVQEDLEWGKEMQDLIEET